LLALQRRTCQEFASLPRSPGPKLLPTRFFRSWSGNRNPSIERDAERLRQGGLSFRLASVSESGNCKQNSVRHPGAQRQSARHSLFRDLAKPGVKIDSSGSSQLRRAQWSILDLWIGTGEVRKATSEKDQARAFATLRAIWRNVISTPGSARERGRQF